MSSRTIGRLVSISSQKIVAEMYESTSNYINTYDGIRFAGEIGSYVSIDDIGRKIIAEVIGIDEKSSFFSTQLNKPNSNRHLNLGLTGEISNGCFTFGVSKMPLIFSEINIISEADLYIMLEVSTDSNCNKKERTLAVGKSVIFPEYKVRVNIDNFFGHHFAIFGNTGTGKSNTIARILQDIFKKKNHSAIGAKFVIFDSNGEYEAAFIGIKELNSDISVRSISTDVNETHKEVLEIPVWALSVDDWAILLHASEKTQVPIIRNAIDIVKIFLESSGNDDFKNHILATTVSGILINPESSPSKRDKIIAILSTFKTNEISLESQIGTKTLREVLVVDYGQITKIEEIIKFFEKFVKDNIRIEENKASLVPYDLVIFKEAVEFAILYEGSISSQRIHEYTATLMTRLRSLMESDQGNLLQKTQFCSIEDYLESLIGGNQILNIDISSLDDSSSEVVTKVISKILFDYLKKKRQKASEPINIIIEEAHRFIKHEVISSVIGYNIFERIAKEGRKFGLLLGISSQRPSELSKTVVSQCSNFIIHRIQNPDDMNYISRMVPYVDAGIIERLTYLQRGHALIFGSSINLPTLTQFERALPPTDSQSADVSEKWYIEKNDINGGEDNLPF